MSYATVKGREEMTQDRIMAQGISEQRPDSPLKALQQWIDDTNGQHRELTVKLNSLMEAVGQWDEDGKEFRAAVRQRVQEQAKQIEALKSRITKLESAK